MDSRISELTAGTPVGTSIFPYAMGIGTTLSSTLNAMIPVITNAGTLAFGVSYIITTPGSATLWSPIECGFAGSIESIRLNSGTVKGNGTIDIYKMTYAEAGTGTPGTAFSMIGTATKPAIAGTQVYQGTTFTGWTATTFAKGDWLYPYVTNSGTITTLTISIGGRRIAI